MIVGESFGGERNSATQDHANNGNGEY